jgi:predicted Zn-dependent protease
MKKIIFPLLVLLLLFFGGFYLLSKVNWMGVFRIKSNSETIEQKLGDLLWSSIEKTEDQITNSKIVFPIDSLVEQLMKKNDLDPKSIKIHIVSKDEVNAFALPGRHMVIYSGLINECKNESELIGVIGNEIAHIEKDHVMRKMVQEIGLAAIVTLTTGNEGAGQVVKQLLKNLSAAAYDRTLEKEADLTAVEYMLKAKVDPEQLANFLYRLSKNDNSMQQLTWLSSHPESKERAEYIVDAIRKRVIEKKSILSTASWNRMKEIVKSENQ